MISPISLLGLDFLARAVWNTEMTFSLFRRFWG